MRAIVGVDPGLDGALALVVDGYLLAVKDMPTWEKAGKTKLAFDADGLPSEKRGVIRMMDVVAVRGLLATWTEAWNIEAVVMERAQVRPEQGASSGAKSMFAAGEVSGVVVGMGLRREFVAAGKWKSDMGVTADKATSLKRIVELEPGMASWFKRKKDDGRAEAALIALWGWRVFCDSASGMRRQALR